MKNKINLTIGLLLLVFLTGACVDISKLFPQSQTTPTPQTATPTPIVEKTQTPDDEREELKEKIEELEKKIDDTQKKTTQPPIIIKEKTEKKPKVPTIRDSKSNARVNSPSDGFLAMRSQPDTETGYRVFQIPHRANVRILGCQGSRRRVSGRGGHWCRVSYGGKTGWAFDAWLVYLEKLK